MTALPISPLAAAAGQSRAGRAKVVLALIACAALLPRIGFLANPFDSDSGLYIYMGKALADGQILYHDFYENKPPGVALFTAPLYRAFGYHWPPYVLLQATMTLVAAYALATSVGRYLGRRTLIPTFAFALVFLNFSPVAYRGFQIETLQCFFASIAAAVALHVLKPQMADDPPPKTRAIWGGLTVGLLAGIAASLKPTAAAIAGAFMIALLLRQPRSYKTIAFTILGLLVAPALVLCWVWRAGLLPDMLPLLREISLYAGTTPLSASDWMKPLVAIVIGGLPFIFVRICRTGAPDAAPMPEKQAFLTLAIAWLTLEMAGVILQRRMYLYHFLPLAPPLALLFGCACANRRPGVYAIALLPILLLSLANSRDELATIAQGQIPTLPQSDYINANASPGDKIIGDPCERLLMETHLTCGARYGNLFYFMNHDNAPQEYGDRFIDDLERNKPRWAVFRTDRKEHRLMLCTVLPLLSQRPQRRENFLAAWEKLDAYIDAHYQPVTQSAEMTIYRRRD